jgi:hypothetical protein
MSITSKFDSEDDAEWLCLSEDDVAQNAVEKENEVEPVEPVEIATEDEILNEDRVEQHCDDSIEEEITFI